MTTYSANFKELYQERMHPRPASPSYTVSLSLLVCLPSLPTIFKKIFPEEHTGATLVLLPPLVVACFNSDLSPTSRSWILPLALHGEKFAILTNLRNMSVLLNVGPKCTLTASHATLWWVMVCMPTGESDRQKNRRTDARPLHYAFRYERT